MILLPTTQLQQVIFRRVLIIYDFIIYSILITNKFTSLKYYLPLTEWHTVLVFTATAAETGALFCPKKVLKTVQKSSVSYNKKQISLTVFSNFVIFILFLMLL